MTLSMAHKALAAGLGMAAALGLSLGLAGCGGSTQDTTDAIVTTEPGAPVSTPGASPGSPAATAPAAGTPASTGNAASTAPAAPTKSEGWGTLKGQVVFGGAPPERKVLEDKGKAEKDPTVCAKDAPILSERLVVDGATKGVKNVFVYIPKPTAVNPDARAAASKADVMFDQKNCVFEPHALGVMEGAKITLKSSDPVNHNVNAKLRSSPFNQLLAAGGTQDFKPGAPERAPSVVTCDIHPWMQAYWMVLDNPYIAVTDEKGNFEIKNVPAGTQKVVVWQEATQFVTAPSGEDVNVAANDTTTKSFTIDPAKVKPAQ